LLVDELQFAQMVGIAQRMTTTFIAEVRLPMVMHGRPAERPQNPGIIHRLVAALGMHLIIRQRARRGHMQPMQRPLYPQPGLIDMQDLRGAQLLFHRFC